MRKAYTLLFLGIWVAIIPFLGFPYAFKDILTTISGLVLVYLSYTIFREYKLKEIKKARTFENFRENKFFAEEVTPSVEENREV